MQRKVPDAWLGREEEIERQLQEQIDSLSKIIDERPSRSISRERYRASPEMRINELHVPHHNGRVRSMSPIQPMPVPLRAEPQQRRTTSKGRLYSSRAAPGYGTAAEVGSGKQMRGMSPLLVPKSSNRSVSTANVAQLPRHPVKLRRTPQPTPPVRYMVRSAPPPPDPLLPTHNKRIMPVPSIEPPRPFGSPLSSRSRSPARRSPSTPVRHTRSSSLKREMSRSPSQPGSRSRDPSPQIHRMASRSPAAQSRSSSHPGPAPYNTPPKASPSKPTPPGSVIHKKISMTELLEEYKQGSEAFPKEGGNPNVQKRDEYLLRLMQQSKLIKQEVDRYIDNSRIQQEPHKLTDAAKGQLRNKLLLMNSVNQSLTGDNFSTPTRSTGRRGSSNYQQPQVQHNHSAPPQEHTPPRAMDETSMLNVSSSPAPPTAPSPSKSTEKQLDLGSTSYEEILAEKQRLLDEQQERQSKLDYLDSLLRRQGHQ